MTNEELIRLIVLGLIIVIVVILVAAEFDKAKFSEQEVLDSLKEWRSAPQIKALIEKNKEGKCISAKKLEDILKKLEVEKKVVSQSFQLTRIEAMSYNQKTLMKYKLA